jgi:hypothetical protein
MNQPLTPAQLLVRRKWMAAFVERLTGNVTWASLYAAALTWESKFRSKP